MEGLIKQGQADFSKNEANFFRRIREIIREDESPFDETTRVKIYYIFNDGCEPYFQFHIVTSRMDFTTDYYKWDYDFKKGRLNNLDELISDQEDVEIFDFFGNQIPL